MTKAFPLVVPLLLIGLAGAGACGVDQTTGSGTPRTETRSVQGFDSVDVTGIGTLTIRQTGTESLTIAADDNILPLIRSEVSGGVLTLGPNVDHVVNGAHIAYTLSVRRLKAIAVHGVVGVSATDIQSPSLSVTIEGTAHVTVAGAGRSEDVSVNGTGRYDGSAFVARTATVEITGPGGVVVNVSDLLSAKPGTVGNVEYIGNPKIERNGLGSITRRG